MDGKIWLKCCAGDEAVRSKWHTEHVEFDKFITESGLWWTHSIWEVMTYCEEEDDKRMKDAASKREKPVELEYSGINQT